VLGSADGAVVDALAARLPHTRAWLAAASGQLPAVEQEMAADGTAADDGSSGAAPHPALPTLRTGLRGSLGATNSPPPSSAAAGSGNGGIGSAGGLPLAPSGGPRSWRGLVRVGLVQLVSGG
jgi:hypothetical protein